MQRLENVRVKRENAKDIFNNIIALGDDFDYRSSIVTGSIIIDGLTISGS